MVAWSHGGCKQPVNRAWDKRFGEGLRIVFMRLYKNCALTAWNMVNSPPDWNKIHRTKPECDCSPDKRKCTMSSRKRNWLLILFSFGAACLAGCSIDGISERFKAKDEVSKT